MLKRTIIISHIVLLTLCCQRLEETSTENLIKYIKQNELTLTHNIYFENQEENKLKFVKSDEFVKVEIYAFGKMNRPSRKIEISLEDYEEIKNGLKCLVRNHRSGEKPTTILNEYHIELEFKKMNLVDFENNCGFENILWDKLKYPNVLDLKNPIG